jgi:hypothetical protein
MKLFLIITILLVSATSFAVTCEDGLEAFKKTLHPKLVISCSKCHGDNGTAAKHSVSDSRLAYGIARTFVDFSQIQKSKFYKKVRSAHWLEHDDSATGMTITEMDQYLNDWWKTGESSCPSPFAFQTTAVEIPKNLPHRTSNQFQKISWNLGETSSSLKGCTASVEAQLFVDQSGSIPKSYRLKNPSIACDSGVMKISGLRFLIDGSTQSFENVYDDVNEEIKHNGQSVVLSSEFLIIISRLEAKEVLSIGFNQLEIVK